MTSLFSVSSRYNLFCFFFQAEDGIRDGHVTGVQTCALPICTVSTSSHYLPQGSADRAEPAGGDDVLLAREWLPGAEIGRASCRERVWHGVIARQDNKKVRNRSCHRGSENTQP